MDAALNTEDIEWNKIWQTHCENDRQVDSLFHGVAIWYRTESELAAAEPTEETVSTKPINVEQERLISEQMSLEEIESSVDNMLNSELLPDSIRINLSDKSVDEKIAHLKRFYEERLESAEDTNLKDVDSTTYKAYKNEIRSFLGRYGSGDPVVTKVLDRHPEWKNMLVVNDWTGSMYRYGAQVLEWHLLNYKHSGIKTITLFNDGDHKRGGEKEIGTTEGIYTEKADNVPKLLDLFNYVMLKGGGGDAQENDIEAILYAIEDKPDFSELILIADNSACVRDIELADRIGVPVRIILCGYSKSNGVNKHYAYLAEVTGGGIYTIDEDIEDLKVKLNDDGEVISIPDERMKLSSNKCNNSDFKRIKRTTEYTLKSARFRKRKVRILNASNSDLDEIPNWLFKCEGLNTLDLSENRLTEVPSKILYLRYLAKLDLSNNQLKELPRSFGRVKYLTHLNLANNLLEETPDQIKYLKHLKELDLSNNSLEKLLSLRTRYLTKLNLANNDFQEIPSSVQRQRLLLELNLSGNSIKELPTRLPSSRKLQKLDMSNNQISSLPEDLTLFIRLTELNLTGNQLSEEDKKRLKTELIHTKVIF